MSRKTITTRDFEPITGSMNEAGLEACLKLEKILKRQHFNEGPSVFYSIAETIICMATGCAIDEIEHDWIPGILADVQSRLT